MKGKVEIDGLVSVRDLYIVTRFYAATIGFGRWDQFLVGFTA